MTTPCAIEFPEKATDLLYRRAIVQQWDPDRDVDWDSLELTKIARAIREPMAYVYTQVQHAEVLAFDTCQRLVAGMPNGWQREIVQTQVVDEWRHVQFFGRVLSKFESSARVHENVVELGEDMRGIESYDEVLVGSHIIETAAHTLFLAGSRDGWSSAQRRTLRLPGSAEALALRSTVVQLVGRDESRHIAIGLRCLADHVSALRPERRSELEIRAVGWAQRVQQLVCVLAPALGRLGVDPERIARRVWRMQQHNLGLLGINLGVWPVADGIGDVL